MQNSALTLLASLSALPLVACGSDDASPRRPSRDAWDVVASAEFVHTTMDDEGRPITQIGDVIVGGLEYNSNFANRGDVIVNFDGPANRILVEFRRFTVNTSENEAQDDFAAMGLWAFNTQVGTPSRPQDMDPDSDCTDTWLPGCAIRAYYDGQTQLGRAGADIRVRLSAARCCTRMSPASSGA